MHAAIITAFKDPAMLATLVEALVARDFRIFIHLDRRSRFDPAFVAGLEAKGCVVRSRHRVVWGGYTHLLAIVGLVRLAVADPAVTYVHTLSGQDYPIRTADEIAQACDGQVFMSSQPLGATAPDIQERFRSYKLLWPIERWRTIPRPFARATAAAQRLLGVRRTRTRDFAFDRLFKGLVWLSMPVEVARHAVEAPQARRFLRDLRFSHLPEEFFFQTVIENSLFAPRLCRDDRRYMDWGPRDGVRPVVLDERDIPGLAASAALFARKFDAVRSAGLIAYLEAASTR